ncbi:CDP-glucose 4,6-dehydratase [Sphingomonas sp. JC676]|uniref:CDP-glucose 4,6-dehydratase n=1 Tax=Sphingomonas sp. JC676 TaxID=2768065 RepID=UPI00292A5522|nr:CDP-glucose 4,6-dehydratase [Sphingomonas sp. JC676]
MRVDLEFWRGRRVFLTGHTGFKGSWLTLMLKMLRARTTGYSLPAPTDPSMFELLGLASALDHHIGDIRDLAAMETAMREAQPEIVFHLAAQPLVRASYAEPVDTFATNLMGTVNLLDACRRVPSVRTVVIVTTDKCYENTGLTRGYAESDPMGGQDPYSSSKGCAELAVSSYRDSFLRAAGIGVASARAGNVIGGGDFAIDRLVPDAMRAFCAGNPLEIRNPAAIRPWQHVLDPLAGYLMLAERLHGDPGFAAGWNFGPAVADAAPVEAVVDSLIECWGEDARWVRSPGTHPHEAATLMLDCSKAGERLGWHPRLSLDEALKLSADWYRCWHEQGDLIAISKDQINQYLSL